MFALVGTKHFPIKRLAAAWILTVKENAVDNIVKIDKAILTAEPSDLSGVAIMFDQVPTPDSGMHRIVLGPDGNMWFTELRRDKVAKIALGEPAP